MRDEEVQKENEHGPDKKNNCLVNQIHIHKQKFQFSFLVLKNFQREIIHSG